MWGKKKKGVSIKVKSKYIERLFDEARDYDELATKYGRRHIVTRNRAWKKIYKKFPLLRRYVITYNHIKKTLNYEE